MGTENHGSSLFPEPARLPRSLPRFPTGSVLAEGPGQSASRSVQLSRACYLVPGVCPPVTKPDTVHRPEDPRCEWPQKDQSLDFFLP